MVTRHPGLMFNGTQIHEQAYAGGIFWTFIGKNGVTEWCELSLPDEDQEMTPQEIDAEIDQIDEKLVRLTTRRKFFLQQRRNMDTEAKKESNPTVDRQYRSDEVASIVEKIRGKQRGNFDAPVLRQIDLKEQSAN